MSLAKIAGAAQALMINAVSIVGVFGAGWPVGTAIALYWAENVLRGAVVLLQLAIVRGDRDKVRSVLLLAVVFNAAHALFLWVILGIIVPRVAPEHRFERASFEQGLLIIAALIAVELIVWLLSSRNATAADAYTRRVVVIHMAIVFGMFGIVLLGRATVFFLSFAVLKTLSDAVAQWRLRNA
jgi:hypothetical protein